MGLNILWEGWNKAYQEVRWIHFACAQSSLKSLYRRILTWSSQLLTVPTSISAFGKIIKASPHYTNTDVKRLAPSKIVVSNIALPSSRPCIVPILNILPDKEAQEYATEENWFVLDHEKWAEMRKIKVNLGLNMVDYVAVIRKLLELRMVTLLPISEVKVINGLQCVSKQDGRQRLIFDGRPINSILKTLEKVALPDFSLLNDWIVDEHEILRFGKLDLDNFYHRLGVPAWMTKFLANLFNLGKGDVCPACLTLPMGLSHAVFLAQKAHLFILRQCSFSHCINNKVSDNSKMWALVYIDDVILCIRSNSIQQAERKLNGYIDESLQTYQHFNLPVNQKKIERATEAITGLGCCLSNKDKSVHPNVDKFKQVVGATKLVIQCERASSKAVETLLGYWLYKEQEYSTRTLWKSVKREFQLAILFADQCFLTWLRQMDSSLIASDASLTGAGACELLLFRPPRNESQWADFIERQLSSRTWSMIVNQQWQHAKHINKVILVIFKLIDLGFPTTALAVYLQFDCFLRPTELCNNLSQHVAFPAGTLLGSQARQVLILLPVTKTGPLQSVRVESSLVQQLLARLIANVARDIKIFPSYFIYRRRLMHVLELLQLSHVGYTPHSIRHGAATMALINKGEKALPEIMIRGCWESSAGKVYLQMGAAALLFAELPDYLIRKASKLAGDLPMAFGNAALTPAT